MYRVTSGSGDSWPWNQKNLDYEIETGHGMCIAAIAFCLKSKEPRLRDWNMDSSTPVQTVTQTWNQKNLDYEIETRR